MKRIITCILAEIILFALLPFTSYAITVAGSNPSDYVVTPPDFGGVAKLIISRDNGTFGCSGALLGSGNFILTAAHCLTDDSGNLVTTSLSATFELPDSNKQTILGSEYYVSPGWDGDYLTGRDIALVELVNPVDPTVERYNLYRGSDEIDKTTSIVGYGRSGTGLTGYTDSYPFGIKRAGLNTYDVFWNFPYSQLVFDFDDGTATYDTIGNLINEPNVGLGTQEVMIAPGDSGGPSFIQNNNDYYIAGIHSFMAAFDVPPNSSFGELGVDTRVSAYTSWIDSVTHPIPEPNTIFLISSGMIGFVSLRKKWKKFV